MLSPGAPSQAEDVADWWSAFGPALVNAQAPWDAAVLGGARADRLGFAFAAGYQAALWSLVPARDLRRTAALCATEAGGAHPRAIETRLTDGVLEGEKTFVTLGPHAQDLYVLAKTGEEAGRPALALVRVDAAAPGVTVTPLGETPFVPEIPHASVRLAGVRAFETLPGDGWADYVRPFRSVEDTLVHAAALAWLGASGMRWGWPREPIRAARGAPARAARVERRRPCEPARPRRAGGRAGSGGLAGRGDGAAVGARARGGPETLAARLTAPRRGEQSPREASRARLGAPVGAGDGSSVMPSARPK